VVKEFRESPEGEWWKEIPSRLKTMHRKVDDELSKRIKELRVKQ